MTFIDHGQFESDKVAGDAAIPRNDQTARLPRANTFLGAELHWSGQSRRGQIRDLSEGGALMVVTPPPAAGTRVILVRGPHRLSASVAWSDANRCGVRFDHPVVVADLISGKGTAQPIAPAPSLDCTISVGLLAELCAQADRLAQQIAVAGVSPSLQAECLALAHALHRVRAAN